MSHKIFQKNAERNVALNILFSEIIKSNQLTVKSDDIKTTVINLAEGYENPKEIIDWYYADKNRLAGAMSLALEEEVVKWVLGQVKVVEQAVDFDEVMGTKPSITATKKPKAKTMTKNKLTIANKDK